MGPFDSFPFISSKIIVVFFVSPTDHSLFLQFIQSHHLPKRLLLIEYIPLEARNTRFPINKLRNIGISCCTTSHYIVLDMDVWLSTSSTDLIASIPPSLLRQPSTAILLPLFFFDRQRITRLCSSIHSCALLFAFQIDFIVKSTRLFPKHEVRIVRLHRQRRLFLLQAGDSHSCTQR